MLNLQIKLYHRDIWIGKLAVVYIGFGILHKFKASLNAWGSWIVSHTDKGGWLFSGWVSQVCECLALFANCRCGFFPAKFLLPQKWMASPINKRINSCYELVLIKLYINVFVCMCVYFLFFCTQKNIIYISSGSGNCQNVLYKFQAIYLMQGGPTLIKLGGFQIFCTVLDAGVRGKSPSHHS